MPRFVTTPPPPYDPNPPSVPTGTTGSVTDPLLPALSVPPLQSPTASEIEIETFGK